MVEVLKQTDDTLVMPPKDSRGLLLEAAENSLLLRWTSPVMVVAIHNTSSEGSLSWHKVIIELGDEEEEDIPSDMVTTMVLVFLIMNNN